MNKTVGPKLTMLLAWTAHIFGHIAGWAITACGLGAILSGIIGILPDSWVATIFIVGFCWAILDIIFGVHNKRLVVDLTPTRPGTVGAILLPSVAASINGDVGHWVNARGDDINAWVSDRTAQWFGQGSYIVVALATLGVSVVLLQQVLRHLKDSGPSTPQTPRPATPTPTGAK